MRASIAYLGLSELVNFNIAVFDMLQAILQFHKSSSAKIEFVFVPFSEGEYSLENVRENGDPVAFHAVYFRPPQGCNISESFHWLLTEVAKLAYTMTDGEIQPKENEFTEGVKKKRDGSFVFNFRKEEVGSVF